MLVHPGCHLGDSWYIVDDDDVIHAYYLVCPDTVERHTAWDIAHATSRDLVSWDLHGIVLRRGEPDAWDGRCLATGSVVRFGGRWLLAYTARWNESGVATGIAVSDDLHTWAKFGNRPATTPGDPYVRGRPWSDRPPTHWRDPFLLVDCNGRLLQLVAAARRDRPADASGTVGVARSSDGRTWRLDDPLDVEPVARELECPQVRKVDRQWFLIFSAFPALFSEALQADPTASLGHGTYAMAGLSPLGPFRFVQRQPILADWPAFSGPAPYAAQVVQHRGQSYLIGTVWRDDGPDNLSDPIALRRKGDWLVPS